MLAGLCIQVAVAEAALFANPFASLLGKQGTIDVAARNFAVPDHERLVTLCESPPVFEIPDFLTPGECEAVIAAAERGAFPAIPYGAKNRIFTGTKWAAHEQDACVDPFVAASSRLFGGVPASRFDPVTVTKYEAGQYQAQHLDARLPHEIRRDDAYLRSGGQRIAQVICYLQPPAAGGETKFYDPSFSGLAMEPKAGSALVFPTATLQGVADERYLHSGEPVGAGTKWIIGSWLMETERRDAADVAAAIDQLWKLSGRERPPAAAAARGEKPAGKKVVGKKRGKARR